MFRPSHLSPPVLVATFILVLMIVFVATDKGNER